jgi:hypothetical protein
MLDRDHVIDGFEELLHVLARAPAMDILCRADRALIGLRAVDEKISQPKKWCRQFQVRRFRPFARRDEPRGSIDAICRFRLTIGPLLQP